MKRNTITKAIISAMSAGALSVCACFGASAQTVNANVTSTLPATLQVGEPIIVTVQAKGGESIETKKAALEKLLNGKTYQKSAYTAESYQIYTAAVEKVKQVLANPGATIGEIESAQNALNTAISGLKPTADTSTATSPKTGKRFSQLVLTFLLVSMTAGAFSVKKITERK